MTDLNAFTVESAMKMVAGTAEAWESLLKVMPLLEITNQEINNCRIK